MASYVLGDDVVLDGFWKSFKKAVVRSPIVQAAKFVVHPVKQTKAALKTISRFDPTSKRAKYRNVTRVGLVGAAVVTGGLLAPGLLGAAATGLKGVSAFRKPPKTITPDPAGLPLNSFTDNTPSPREADASIASQYGAQPATSDKRPMIGLGIAAVAAAVTVFALVSKKKA